MINSFFLSFFFWQGHDTTAMALCFTLLLLAENKAVQVCKSSSSNIFQFIFLTSCILIIFVSSCKDKARAEVDALLEEKDIAKLSMRDINGLAYLDRCLKESLRLFPSVPFISRQVNEDLKLSELFFDFV